MFNFNSSRSIFPAYSGESEVEVRWPTPPNRNSVNRTLNVLWNIHEENPHVVANSGPGIEVPLPDNGFNPNGLSNNSIVNEFVNRASSQLSPETRSQIAALVQENYNQFREHESEIPLFDLKAEVRDSYPGVFCLYNGTSKTRFQKALSIVKALEKSAESWSKNSPFELDAKEEFVSFLKPSPPAFNALLTPKSALSQRVLQQTTPVDCINDVMLQLGLADENPAIETQDEDFKGLQTQIALLESQERILGRERLLSGDLSRCFHSVCGQIPSILQSKDCSKSSVELLNRCRAILAKRQAADCRKLLKIYAQCKNELRDLGIDPATLPKLTTQEHKIETILEDSHAPKPLSAPLSALPSTRNVDSRRSAVALNQIANQIPRQNGGLISEVCILLCCCDNLQAKAEGLNKTEELAHKLADSLEQIPRQEMSLEEKETHINLLKTKSKLREARNARSMQNLSKSTLSEDRKDLLSQFVGA